MKTVNGRVQLVAYSSLALVLTGLAGCAGSSTTASTSNGDFIDLSNLDAPAVATGAGGARDGSSGPRIQLTPMPPASRSLPITRDQKVAAIIDGNWAEVPYIPMGDSATVERILDEGVNRNKVMEHITHLTQQIGPRLTGSSRAERANHWARDQFASWGLDARVEQWGTIPVRFDRNSGKGRAVTPGGSETAREFELTWPAWSAGTKGPMRGAVIAWPKDEEAWAKVKDSIKGSWVLMPKAGEEGMRRMGFLRQVYKDREDARKAIAEGKKSEELTLEQRMQLAGALGFIAASPDEKVRTNGAPGWRTMDPAKLPTDVDVTVRKSDFDYLYEKVEKGEAIDVEFDLNSTLTPGPIPTYNTVADLKGTTWPDEIVVVCGHMDSWDGPGSQGTTDNGTGTSVTLEAARILASVGARPKRTIRFILWTGEEQGLLGSKGYVDANKETMYKHIVCLNDDGGTNYEGGLKGIASQRDMLANATAPVTAAFPSMAINVQVLDSFPRFAASDHYSFVEVGVPGFFWDEVGRADYGYGWHTQHDKLELAIPEYLVQSSTCQAVTAYNLACSDEPLAREPAPTGTAAPPRNQNERGGQGGGAGGGERRQRAEANR